MNSDTTTTVGWNVDAWSQLHTAFGNFNQKSSSSGRVHDTRVPEATDAQRTHRPCRTVDLQSPLQGPWYTDVLEYLRSWWNWLLGGQQQTRYDDDEDNEETCHVTLALAFGHFCKPQVEVDTRQDVEILAVLPVVTLILARDQRYDTTTLCALQGAITEIADGIVTAAGNVVAPVLGLLTDKKWGKSPVLVAIIEATYTRMKQFNFTAWSYTGRVDRFLTCHCDTTVETWHVTSNTWNIAHGTWIQEESRACINYYDQVGTGTKQNQSPTKIYLHVCADRRIPDINEIQEVVDFRFVTAHTASRDIPVDLEDNEKKEKFSYPLTLKALWDEVQAPARNVGRNLTKNIVCAWVKVLLNTQRNVGESAHTNSISWTIDIAGVFSSKAYVKCCCAFIEHALKFSASQLTSVVEFNNERPQGANLETAVQFSIRDRIPVLICNYRNRPIQQNKICSWEDSSRHLCLLGYKCSDIWQRFSIDQTEPVLNLHLSTEQPPGKQSHKKALCCGDVEYHHYKLFGKNDTGWGCAYRSVQTTLSWILRSDDTSYLHHCRDRLELLRNGERSSIILPSHTEIQEILVQVDGKDKSIVRSTQWIGTFEGAKIIEHLTAVTCKHVHFQDASNISDYVEKIIEHFETGGGPILVGGGSLAVSIVGASMSTSGEQRWILILDPHYSGSQPVEDAISGLKNDTNTAYKSSSAPPIYWQRIDILNCKKKAGPFVRGTFYNLCIPLLKKEIM